MFQTTNQKKTMKNPSLQNKLAHSATDPMRSDPTFPIAFVPNTTTLSRNQRFQNIPPTNKKCFLLINVAGFRKPIDWYWYCFSKFGTQTYHWVTIIFRPLFWASMRKPHEMDLSKTNDREKPLVYQFTIEQIATNLDDKLMTIFSPQRRNNHNIITGSLISFPHFALKRNVVSQHSHKYASTNAGTYVCKYPI